MATSSEAPPVSDGTSAADERSRAPAPTDPAAAAPAAPPVDAVPAMPAPPVPRRIAPADEPMPLEAPSAGSSPAVTPTATTEPAERLVPAATVDTPQTAEAASPVPRPPAAEPAPLPVVAQPRTPLEPVTGPTTGLPADLPRPVQIRIGAVEVRATVPPPPVPALAAAGPRRSRARGFDEYRSVRSHAGWDL
jgi:hypothetical protein